MDEPILRATDVSGEVFDDPSEDLLFMLFEDLEEPGDRFSVERVEVGREHELMRVRFTTEGSYEIEGPRPGDEAECAFMRNAHEALTRWAFDLGDWREPLSRTTESE